MTGFLAPGMQGNLGFPSSVQQNHLRDKEEPSHLLNLYLLDYLKKRKFPETAAKFQQEASLVDTYNLDFDTPNGFLYEWWCAFMEIFMSRQNPAYSEAGARYNEAQRQKHMQQQQFKHQQQVLLRMQSMQQQQQQGTGLPDVMPSKLEMMLKQGAGPGASGGIGGLPGAEQRGLGGLGPAGRSVLAGFNSPLVDKNLASMAGAGGWGGGAPGGSLMPGVGPMLAGGLLPEQAMQLRLQQHLQRASSGAVGGRVSLDTLDLVNDVGPSNMAGTGGQSTSSPSAGLIAQAYRMRQHQQAQQQQSSNSLLPPFSSAGVSPNLTDLDIRKSIALSKNNSPGLLSQIGPGGLGPGGGPAGGAAMGASSTNDSPFAGIIASSRQQQLAGLGPGSGVEDKSQQQQHHQLMSRQSIMMQRMLHQQHQQQQQQQSSLQIPGQSSQAMTSQGLPSSMGLQSVSTSQPLGGTHSNPGTPQLPPLTPQSSWPNLSGNQKNGNGYNGSTTGAAAAGTPTSGDNQIPQSIPASGGGKRGKGGKATNPDGAPTSRKRKMANGPHNTAATTAPSPQTMSSPGNPSSNTIQPGPSNNLNSLNNLTHPHHSNHANQLGDPRTPPTTVSDWQINLMDTSNSQQLSMYPSSMHGMGANGIFKEEDMTPLDLLPMQEFDNEDMMGMMGGPEDSALADNVLSGLLPPDCIGTADLGLKDNHKIKRDSDLGEDGAGDMKRRKGS